MRTILFRLLLFRLLSAKEPVEGIRSLQSPEALKAWTSRIAVFVAREHIRRRRRERRFTLFEAPPEIPAPDVPTDSVREAARSVYAILDRMPVDERLVLTLSLFNGMVLEEPPRRGAASRAEGGRDRREAT